MSCPIVEKEDAESCMMEQSVSLEPKEENIVFGSAPSFSCFIVAFDA